VLLHGLFNRENIEATFYLQKSQTAVSASLFFGASFADKIARPKSITTNNLKFMFSKVLFICFSGFVGGVFQPFVGKCWETLKGYRRMRKISISH